MYARVLEEYRDQYSNYLVHELAFEEIVDKAMLSRTRELIDEESSSIRSRLAAEFGHDMSVSSYKPLTVLDQLDELRQLAASVVSYSELQDQTDIPENLQPVDYQVVHSLNGNAAHSRDEFRAEQLKLSEFVLKCSESIAEEIGSSVLAQTLINYTDLVERIRVKYPDQFELIEDVELLVSSVVGKICNDNIVWCPMGDGEQKTYMKIDDVATGRQFFVPADPRLQSMGQTTQFRFEPIDDGKYLVSLLSETAVHGCKYAVSDYFTHDSVSLSDDCDLLVSPLVAKFVIDREKEASLYRASKRESQQDDLKTDDLTNNISSSASERGR